MMPSNNNYAAWVYGSLQRNAARFCSTERLQTQMPLSVKAGDHVLVPNDVAHGIENIWRYARICSQPIRHWQLLQ